MLLENLLKIENQINKKNNSTLCDNYYKFISIYTDEINELYQHFTSSKKELQKYFTNEANYIKKLQLIFNESIKNEFEYVALILTILTIKSFYNIKVFETVGENRFNSENYIDVFESSTIINSILNDFKLFLIWIEIFLNENTVSKQLFQSNFSKARLGIFKFMIILNQKEKITISKKWINNKSLIFYILNIKNKNFIFLNLFNKKFKVYERNEKTVYIFINHYTNVFEVLRRNIHSGEAVKIDVNSDFFKNVLNVRAKIDYESLEYFFNKKLKNLLYDKNLLHNYYWKVLDNLKDSIKENDDYAVKILSKKMSELLDLLRIFEILKEKKNCFFYFPILLCFRGRAYFTSSVSFTFYKELRYCLYEDNYPKDFTLPSHPLNDKIEKILSNYHYKLEYLKFFSFNEKNNNIKNSILWIIISIAEINKKKIGAEITIDSFLDYGIKVLNEEIILENLDEYDDLKLYSLKKILKEVNTDKYVKRLISKDATASCFQHLIKILGHETIDSLIWCNLKSCSTWYDTYMYILNKWIVLVSENLNQDDINLIKKHFTRSSIKKPTMTLQYGASYKRCWEYFFDEVKKNYVNDEDLTKLKYYFKKYYEFINQNIGLLDKNPKEMIISLQEINNKITLIDGVEVNLNYYLSTRRQIKVTINNTRFTKQNMILTDSLDYNKIKTSSRANYIHSHDSAVIRYIISIKPLLSVHDCFLIDYRSTTFLISLVNDAMRKSFHDLGLNKMFKTTKIFSIFIVI